MQHVKAVILDWAGTAVDHGSMAPAAAMQAVFAESGIPITMAEARTGMGLLKRDHITRIMSLARVRQVWAGVHGSVPTPTDADVLYTQFIPLQMSVLRDYVDVIEGVVELMADLRGRGLKVGSTTGYTRVMMDVIAPLAAEAGFQPHSLVTPDEVGAGRPRPWMIFENMRRMDVSPPVSVVKVGDTIVDIEEGQQAGCWTVAVTRTGNEVRLSAGDLAALPPAEQAARVREARRVLEAQGPDYVIESAMELPGVLDEIEARLSRGESPRRDILVKA